MRYENWDVLLFPETSKIPIQEFKTQCFVTKDRDSPYLQSPSVISPATYFLPQGNVGQLPVLTTFVPSLLPNTPFRVSIHSWERPRPSRLMESLLQPDDVLLFEIRVFIDGVCVSGSVFGQRTAWPHVIDLSSHLDKNGNQDTLRFPPFHQEILEQRHWDAGESHGRIRVVMAEGFSRPNRSPPFERVKDIIAFSFQHAPLHILEYSNIAWPNSAMWAPAPRVFKYNSGSAYSDLKEMDEAHGHSPTRYESRASASQTGSLPLYNTWMPRDFPVPLTQWQSNPRDPRWPRQEPYMSDPFIEPYVSDRSSRRGARSSAEDVPMPDYVGSSSSSRVISSMTGVSYEHSKQSSAGAAPIDEEQYNQVAEALIPPAAYVSGTHAPANTPTVAVPAGPRMSAAAEARTRSYSKSGSQGSVLKEISDPNSRNVSRNVSESSAKPDPAAESTMEPATKRLQVSPSPQVKGKKEGSGQENKENEGAVETPTRDLRTPSKTLRTSGSAESQRTRSGSHLSKEEEVASTPSKDVSPAAADDPVLRGSLENIFDSGIQLGGGVSEVPGID